MSQENVVMLSIDEKRITSELDRAGYKKMGVTIKAATSYAQANEIVENEKIDIIVINLDHESIQPIQICKHFKSTSEIPVVLTSVQSFPKKVKSMSQGADLLVEQPIPRQFFIEKIRNLLEQKVRDTSRVSIVGDVTFELEGASKTCGIKDLSRSGILLSTDMQIKSGTLIPMSFNLPGYKKPIKVEGEVVRSISEKAANGSEIQVGVGVRFGEFSGDSQKRLEKYMTKSQTDDPKMVYYL